MSRKAPALQDSTHASAEGLADRYQRLVALIAEADQTAERAIDVREGLQVVRKLEFALLQELVGKMGENATTLALPRIARTLKKRRPRQGRFSLPRSQDVQGKVLAAFFQNLDRGDSRAFVAVDAEGDLLLVREPDFSADYQRHPDARAWYAPDAAGPAWAIFAPSVTPFRPEHCELLQTDLPQMLAAAETALIRTARRIERYARHLAERQKKLGL